MKHPKRSTVNRSYSAKPHHIFRPNFAAGTPSPAAVLSHKAAHLLDNLVAQYNGKNNGDLSAAPKIMALFGWSSHGSVDDAIKVDRFTRSVLNISNRAAAKKGLREWKSSNWNNF